MIYLPVENIICMYALWILVTIPKFHTDTQKCPLYKNYKKTSNLKNTDIQTRPGSQHLTCTVIIEYSLCRSLHTAQYLTTNRFGIILLINTKKIALRYFVD